MRVITMAVAVYVMSCAAVASASTFSFNPTLTVSEEFTDNVHETREEKKTDFITRLMPGLTLQYRAPLWDWDTSYVLDFRHYAKQEREEEITHYLRIHGLLRPVENFFFIELDETYQRVTLDVTRDNTSESLFYNQADQNQFTAFPYFVWRLAPQTSLRTGYRYINTWYSEDNGESRVDHEAFAEVGREVSSKAKVTGVYVFTDRNTADAGEEGNADEGADFQRHDVSVGGRYEFGERSFVYGYVGNTWINYRSGEHFDHMYWNAGVSGKFGNTVAVAGTGMRFIDDPQGFIVRETFYSMSFEREFPRGQALFTAKYSKFDGSDETFLDTTRYMLGIRGSYDVLEDLKATLAFETDNFIESYMSKSPRRFYGNGAISYSLSKTLKLTLGYIFVDYYSRIVESDNRQINRIILELSKTF